MAFSQRYCSFLFLCLALLVVVCFADEVNKRGRDDVKTIRGSDVSTRMLSQSGKIMMVRDDDDNDDSGDGDDMDDNDNDDDSGDDNEDDNDDDDEDFSDDNDELLSFELDKIEEKDADGNDVGKLEMHSVDSFDNVKFTFSQVDSQADYQGVPAINVNMSAYLPDQMATIDIIVYLFRRSGSVSFGSETFDVESGTVKFNVKVSDWDFCDGPADCSESKAGEFLDLKIKFKSMSSPDEVSDDDRKRAAKKPICKKNDNDNDDGQADNDNDDDDDCPRIYDIGGNSEMVLNKGVITDDDKYTAMPQGFPKFEYEEDEKKFVFRIPRFNQNVLIDPSVNVGKVNSAASWGQINAGLALLIHFAALFAIYFN